jgi:hypothetical protein
MYFNAVDKGSDDVNRLWADVLVFQHLLQVSDLPTIELREVGMDLNIRIPQLGPQFGIDFLPALLQFAQFFPNRPG